MKFLFVCSSIFLMASTSCGNSGAVSLSHVNNVATSEGNEDTSTVIDLNSGERVRIHINPTNDITTNIQTGEIVRIYVVPATKDTFDGLNGRLINHAIMKTALGTYGVDMTKVKLDDKPYSNKKEVVKE